MRDSKLMAGHAVRRARRQGGLTQAAMAEMLGISPSYLNLVERNQRPVSATLLVRLAERFDFDPVAGQTSAASLAKVDAFVTEHGLHIHYVLETRFN